MIRLSLLCLILVSCVHAPPNSSAWLDLFPGYKSRTLENSADPDSQHLVDSHDSHIFIAVLASNLQISETARYFQGRRNYLESLFQNDEDPYFSRTNRIDSCIRQLNLEGTAQKGNTWQLLKFQLPATDQFVLGQCNDALESYQSEIIYLYCEKEKAVLEIKHFQPKVVKNSMSFDPERICENI